MRIILASRSPARKELMEKLVEKLRGDFLKSRRSSRDAAVTLECRASGYHEDMRAYKQSWRLAQHLALGKARWMVTEGTEKFTSAVIVGADTFIVCGAKKIGKPTSVENAKQIIRSMSGRVIGVYSGVAVAQTDAQGVIVREEVAYALTRLHIKKMSSDEVSLLAHQKDALQISGAFSIEGEGGKMITKIDGDYDNVIGLPIFLLKKMLVRLNR